MPVEASAVSQHNLLKKFVITNSCFRAPVNSVCYESPNLILNTLIFLFFAFASHISGDHPTRSAPIFPRYSHKVLLQGDNWCPALQLPHQAAEGAFQGAGCSWSVHAALYL